MRRPIFALVLFALLLKPVATKEKRDPHAARFGDLAITVTALESTEAQAHKGDRHSVAVFVTVKNTGKSAVCMSFRATLAATYGLTYAGSGGNFLNKFPEAPKIWEMLPGEESSGSYVFITVKDGVKPLELTLKPVRKTLHCGSSEPGWKEIMLPQELRFDVRDLPGLKKEPQESPPPPGPTAQQKARATERSRGRNALYQKATTLQIYNSRSENRMVSCS